MKEVLKSLISPTNIGSSLCIIIGITDLWFFHALAAGEINKTLLFLGLGGFLGYSVPTVRSVITSANSIPKAPQS